MSRWWVLALAAGLFACAGGLKGFVRYEPEELARIPNVHGYRGAPACQACHVDGKAELLGGPIDTCRRCHPARHTPGHEAGSPAGKYAKVDLPFPGGVVVCHTCHDPHDVKRERHGLRLPVNELCRRCHSDH